MIADTLPIEFDFRKRFGKDTSFADFNVCHIFREVYTHLKAGIRI